MKLLSLFFFNERTRSLPSYTMYMTAKNNYNLYKYPICTIISIRVNIYFITIVNAKQYAACKNFYLAR